MQSIWIGPAGARLRFVVTFAQFDYANLSMYDEDGAAILFHLSLRAADGLVVCNDRNAEGRWGREVSSPLDLSAAAYQVDIRIRPHATEVWINDTRVRSFTSRLVRRSRFLGLDQARILDLNGGFPVAGFDVAPPLDTLSPNALIFSDRLALHAALPTAPDALQLQINDETFQPIVDKVATADSPLWDAAVMVPGRVWRNVDPSDSLEISLLQGEAAICRRSFDRAELVKHISPLLAQAPERLDFLAASQVLEHAFFADLHAVLSPEDIRALARLSDHHGLAKSFVFDTGKSAPPPDVATRPATLEATELAFAAFSSWLLETPEASDDAVVEKLDSFDLETWERAEITLWAAEWFCHADRVPLLARIITRKDMPKVALWPDSPRRNLSLAPVLWHIGWHDDARQAIWDLKDYSDWLDLGCLAWVVKEAIRDATIDPELQSSIVYAGKAYIDQQGPGYWARGRSRDLISIAVALMRAGDRVPHYLLRDSTDWTIRHYGLSPAFWRDLDAAGGAAGTNTALEDARRAFDQIRRGTADPACEDAICFFERQGNRDCWQMRLELFGPAGVEDPTAFLRRTDWPGHGQAALRAAAFPTAASNIVPSDLLAASGRAMHEAYRPNAASQSYFMQRRAGAWAHELATQMSDPTLDGLPTLLAAAGPDAHGTGLVLGAALIHRLQGPAPEHADAIAAALTEKLARLGHPARQDLMNGAAPRSALRRLAMIDDPSPGTLALIKALGKAPDVAPGDAPLFDTTVVIFSCKPNLATRIPAIRDSWIKDLDALGVPWIVITGDGDGTLQDGVVALDAPDDYEGLPQKTLAAVRWVHDNTTSSHLMKVDDDCFLNAEEVFLSLSHLGADYYGRALSRQVGQTDRTWHFSKSKTDRGRFEVDKSPEPSRYCDGGSGYALSRYAMDALLQTADSPAGHRVVGTSLTEDKMVGDLLSLCGIVPKETDYRISVRRKDADGTAVTQFEDGFDPSQAAPVKLIHLDTHETMEQMAESLQSPHIAPKKIWPTYDAVALGNNSNSLQFIGRPEALDAAREAPVTVVAVMRNEMFMLPSFLKHYRDMGAQAFLIADNMSDDGTRAYLAAQPDVALFSAHTEYRYSNYGVAWQQAMMGAFRSNKWCLIADADELLVPSGAEAMRSHSLADLAAAADAEYSDAYRIFMLDLYPQGPLSAATFEGSPFDDVAYCDRTPFLHNSLAKGPFSDQPTWTSALRHRLIAGARPGLFVAQKIAMLKYRPWHRMSGGIHYVSDAQISSREMIFAHLKYNADFRRRAVEEVSRRQHFNDAEEYRKYMDLTSEGREIIFDPEVSIHWMDCEFVQDRLLNKP